MKTNLLLGVLIILLAPSLANAQQYQVKGLIQDENNEPVIYSNVIFLNAVDSSMVKIEATNDEGEFLIAGVSAGDYFIKISNLGYEDLIIPDISVSSQDVDLGTYNLVVSSVQLEAATVVAKRPLIEVKPDKTVFNVQGTINAVGEDGLALLRKAPGVLVDNNNSITVLGRSGVLFYVDGKRLPLAEEELTNYLRSLTAEQIDRIDIISNPGAKYEAEGNAGIIDIRLKRNENHGANGGISTTLRQGKRTRYNASLNGNYRNSLMNTFGSISYSGGIYYEDIAFNSTQNGLRLMESTVLDQDRKNINLRIGTDFYVAKNQTFGFLVNTYTNDLKNETDTRNVISLQNPNASVDSILIAENNSTGTNNGSTFNLNYVFDNSNQSLNVDADYGRYRNENYYIQPNTYYDPTETNELTSITYENDTPVEIDIYTFKVDYETNFLGGKFGVGTKLSQVKTDNGFLFYNVPERVAVFDERRSNIFVYDEKVYAGYVSYNRTLNEKWSLSSGLRVEQTDATGDLQAFRSDLQEDPVILDYTNLFPSLGLTYQVSQGNTLAFNIGRRINRPDYNVLNPFEWQLSEISFSKGNPNLQPEIVNNIELGYTLKWRYNFKLAYSVTTDQITRLIGPDDRDVRANFINWDNLAEQRILSFNLSAPVGITDKLNSYFNANLYHQDNQADYGNGQVIDLQTLTFTLYQQHSYTLPKGWSAELSGWYTTPGIWGGVFKYDSQWALNLGIQKKLLNDQMNVKLSFNDIFFQSWWSGVSEFNGLISEGRGQQDSQTVALSVSYNFGNQKVKSRNRKTGIEDEAGRVGG